MAKKKIKDKAFQKVKLRVGRKLVKSNETKTDFKTKKLILSENHLTPTDPIKQLSNSINTHSKLLCLNKLNTSLRNVDINVDYGQLVNNVCKYFTDNDNRVRSEAFKCIEQLIRILVSKEKAVKTNNKDNTDNTHTTNNTPIMSIILSYLNCAFTHINESIVIEAQKLLSTIINACHYSLFDQLMPIILTRIQNKTIDLNDYDICSKMVDVMHKHDAHTKRTVDNEKVKHVLKWCSHDSYYDLTNSDNYYAINDNMSSINLSFPSLSSINIKDKFLAVLKSIVTSDIQHLLIKHAINNIQSLTISEARKVIYALNISAIIGLDFDFDIDVLGVNISATNSNKKQQNSILQLKKELCLSYTNLIKSKTI